MKTNKSIIVKILLWPLSAIYGLGVGIRNFMFDCGILPSKQFDVPVISVGNITVGGTGKTPFSEYLIRLLQTNHRVGLLSRGYKRSTSGYQLLTASSTPKEVGDEPYQIKRKFPEIMVAVDANRRHGITKMLNEPINKPDIIILDDAYQHRYVLPDISILLVDYNRMITEDSLLPIGQLREPVKSKNRANIIVVTKCPSSIPPIEFRIIRKNLGIYPYQSLYFTTLVYGDWVPLFPTEKGSQPSMLENMKKLSVLAVTGIASPLPFEEHVRTLAQEVLTLNFPDHHNFTQSNLQKMESLFDSIQKENKVIVTTEKDAVRLMNHPKFPDKLKPYIYYVPLSVSFLKENDTDFDKKIWSYLEKNKNFSQLIAKKGEPK